MPKDLRKPATFAFVATAAFLAMASFAYACVTFKGDMTVTGSNKAGNTVTGSGGQHAYCPGGGATTAAAGTAGSSVTVSVAPASACNPYTYNTAAGPVQMANQLPDGLYEVRINLAKSYTGADGSSWTMIGSTGCFLGANASTTKTLGVMAVAAGSGSATVTLPPNPVDSSTPTLSPAGEAYNFCVGNAVPAGLPGEIRPGMLAPFRVVV